jgi:acetolactate synthase-1/2/3 large subunit
VNGAEALLRTLVGCGVDVCFANPGTSEMHFVAALDTVPEMRAVLTLFEGGATGAADGYARMAGKPAATLLHLGPGLGNGLANLHNARRAGSPVVTVVGDHATFHKPLDAPLESDIDAVAGSVSGWVRRTASPAEVGPDAADAVAAAVGGGIQAAGQVATLILPADVSWTEDEGCAAAQVTPGTPLGRGSLHADTLEAAAKALGSGERCTILIGGDATREDGLLAASRIAAATGAQVLVETFPARHERGAGLPAFERLAYAVPGALRQLADTRHLILAGAAAPVSFFGYPDTPSVLSPEGCEVHEVATHRGAGAAGLRALADLVAGDAEPVLAAPARPELPSGDLTVQSVAQVIGALLPERTIVVDESVTSGFALPSMTAGAPRHDVLTLTGGAIGYGLPAATGAAVACPDRPVWCLEADGSAMYTISALWTHAREHLDVTTIVFNNAAYAILRLELANVGATAPAAGSPARRLLDLGDPRLDFVSIATGMGVPAVRVTTAEELADALRRAAAEPGPHLVEALVPPLAP